MIRVPLSNHIFSNVEQIFPYPSFLPTINPICSPLSTCSSPRIFSSASNPFLRKILSFAEHEGSGHEGVVPLQEGNSRRVDHGGSWIVRTKFEGGDRIDGEGGEEAEGRPS